MPNVVKKTPSTTNPFAKIKANDAYMNVNIIPIHMYGVKGNNGISQLANNLKQKIYVNFFFVYT